MDSITIKPNSNSEIKELLDPNVPYILIHKFQPSETISWWETDIKINNNFGLQNAQVRGLQFDLKTNLKELEKIIDLNTRNLSIYQFSKPIPDTLDLDTLPEKNKLNILKQNGLKHIFFIHYEFLTIESFQKEFLDNSVILKNKI